MNAGTSHYGLSNIQLAAPSIKSLGNYVVVDAHFSATRLQGQDDQVNPPAIHRFGYRISNSFTYDHEMW